MRCEDCTNFEDNYSEKVGYLPKDMIFTCGVNGKVVKINENETGDYFWCEGSEFEGK